VGETWLAHIEGLDGCHTYGRTRTEAEARIREALAAWLDREPADLTIVNC
jgi:predicted RNase H-like HicB family nuclease